MVEIMHVTGKSLGEIMAWPREELYLTRQAIGQWNRKRESKVRSAGGPPGTRGP